MTDYYLRYANFSCFMRFMVTVEVLSAIYVFFKSAETGDQPWLWIPFLIILPFIGIPAYIIYRLKVRSDDRQWDREQLVAEKHRGGYVSRRTKNEKELREQYYRGKGRRN